MCEEGGLPSLSRIAGCLATTLGANCKRRYRFDIPMHVVVPSVSCAASPQGRAATIRVEPSAAGTAKPVVVCGVSSATPLASFSAAGGCCACPVAGGEEPAVLPGGGPPRGISETDGTPVS